MKHVSFTSSVNAGLAATFKNGSRFWLDALSGTKLETFSYLSKEQYETLIEHPDFVNPDLISFSHCHGDHFDKAYTEHAHTLWPLAPIVLPEKIFQEQYLLEGNHLRVVYKGIEIVFFRSVHEGELYTEVPHFACIFNCPGFRILVGADSALASPEIKEQIASAPIDLAILNFPWATLPKGRRFINEVIRPSHLLITHVPLPSDDTLHFRVALEKSIPKLSVPDVRVMWGAFQKEEY